MSLYLQEINGHIWWWCAWDDDDSRRRREEFHEKGVKFNFNGDLHDKRIPEENKKLMKETEYITKDNEKLNLVFAFNYGSHKEIHNAVHKIAFGHYFYLKLSAWLFTKKHIENNASNSHSEI